MSAPRIFVVGAAGQLGSALLAAAPHGVSVAPLTSSDVDLRDAKSVSSALAGLRSDDVVVNTAAYTAVDAAETESADAFAVNGDGPRHLATVTADAGARLVHVSTDYVFTAPHGTRRPLEPADLDVDVRPATVYGASKLAGERGAQEADPSSIIVRTAWVFTGGPTSSDFVGTMRRLEEQRDAVSVVDDQHGSPTYAPDLAVGLWELIGRAHQSEMAGRVLHAVNDGEATWYRLAREVFAGIGADPARVRPCTTADFPRPAPRPQYSVLSGRSWREAGLTPLRSWRDAVADAVSR